MKSINFIFEGGNVFKLADGTSATSRINLSDIEPTVKWLESLTGLPLLQNMLGSTGRKESSGDLDLAVDFTKTSKDALIAKLQKWTTANKVDQRDFIRKTGESVHFKTPIGGDPNNGFVQTDFMFGDPPWQHFAMGGGENNSQFKGVHRHLLMSSIAKALGLKWSYKHGLVSRASGNVITRDPEYIAEILLGAGHTSDELGSVERILRALKGRPDYEEVVSQFKDDIQKEGLVISESDTFFENANTITSKVMQQKVPAGMKVLGFGLDQMAFLDEKTNHVIKLFGGHPNTPSITNPQKAFIAYTLYCKNHPNNPFLPKILKCTRFKSDGIAYLFIKTERLYKVDQALGDELHSLVNYIEMYGGRIFDIDADINTDAILQRMSFDNFKLLWRTISDLDDLAKANNWYLDLHSGNFMERSDGQVVINDPFTAF
jgi:hypothetical protein